MELKNKKIAFLGDSITEGVGVTDLSNMYYNRIQRECGIRELYIDGIGGTRIARQKNPSEKPRHDLYFIPRVDDIDEDCDLIVVFGGTNDFGHGDAPIGRPIDRTPYTFYGALHTLFTGLINKYPTSKICVITPLHRLVEENGNGKLIDFVKVVREVAEFYSLPVLDLYANLGINPQVPVMKETFMPDGLHPNAEGYKVIAEKVAAFIRAM